LAADELRQLIIKHTADGTPGARDYRFTSNLRDAISSACRNQAEGFARYKHKPQKPYFNTARSSLKETEDGIRDGELRGHFSKEVAKEMNALCKRASVGKPALPAVTRSARSRLSVGAEHLSTHSTSTPAPQHPRH